MTCLLLAVVSIAAEPATTTPVKLSPLIEHNDRNAWELRRAELARQWADILGPLPERPPLEQQLLLSEDGGDHLRLLIRYRNEGDTFNDAYLLLPKKEGKLPGMVVLHPTDDQTIRGPVGLANRETNHHALHLVRRGYVCVAPKNFLWENEGQTWQEAADELKKARRFRTGMARMVFDAMRAVDLLVDWPQVDHDRVGAIGHSLGGKEVLYLAAFDPRIRATISSEGGIGLSYSNWDADWYFGQKITRPDFGHDNHEVLALIAPRAFLLIGGEAADGTKSQPYIDAVRPIWKLYGAENRLQLIVHDAGHVFPKPGKDRDRAYDWLDEMMR